MQGVSDLLGRRLVQAMGMKGLQYSSTMPRPTFWRLHEIPCRAPLSCTRPIRLNVNREIKRQSEVSALFRHYPHVLEQNDSGRSSAAAT